MNELRQQLEESRQESKKLKIEIEVNKLESVKREQELVKKLRRYQNASELENEIWNTYGDGDRRCFVRSTSERDVMHNIEIINAIMRNNEALYGMVGYYKVMRGPYLGTIKDFERDLDVVTGLANMRRMKNQGTYDEWMQWLEKPPPT